MATADLLRLDVRGRYLGQLIVNTYYYREISQIPALPGELAPIEIGGFNGLVLCDAFAAEFAAPYSAYAVEGMVFDRLRVALLRPRKSERRATGRDINWHSADARQGMPPQIAAVIKRVCSPGTRAGNGRVYYAGIPSLDVAENELVTGSSCEANLQQIRQRMRFPLMREGMVWNPGVVNPRVAPPLGLPYSFYPLQSATLRVSIGQNRHRAPGHGRSG